MSLTVPLAVRLQTSRQDRHITRDLRDLTFRSVVPGGFASIQLALDRPLHIQPDEIDYYATATVYGPDGRTLCEGRLEDPGRGASGDGLVWDIAAVGPSAHASDRKRQIMYVDGRLTPWEKRINLAPSAEVNTTGDNSSGAVAAVQLNPASGTSCGIGYEVVAQYQDVRWAGQKLARISVDWDAGVTDTNWRLNLLLRVGDVAGSQVADAGLSTAGGTAASDVSSGSWTANADVARIRLQRITSSTTSTDNTWLTVQPRIRTLLKDKAGSDITTGYTLNTVLASEVVADLLGRILTAYDGPGATIAATSFAIDQLAYPEGVTAAQIFADLMALEPAYYWAAWERNTNGRSRFEWTTWPTQVRYEASPDDGFDSPGSAADLYNAVTVRWVDSAGIVRFTARSQTVAALDAAGIVREAYLDLGETSSSSATATQAGDAFLAEHKTPPNAGTLTVARPIVDLLGGGMVQPYEIRPGTLIRVRGVLPRVDSLNATDRDGVTVFRVVGVTYRASSASAELELDSYPRTVAQALAALQRRK